MRRPMPIRLIGLLLLPAALAAHSTEQRVYQWTDSQGVVHYSQFEPPQTPSQARDLHSISDPAPPPPPAPKTPEQTACDVATANLGVLSGGKQTPLTANKDAKGKAVPMTADEIKAAKELAESQIRQFCKVEAKASDDDDEKH